MGGIVIDIWEKSNFLGAFGSKKDAKNTIFHFQKFYGNKIWIEQNYTLVDVSVYYLLLDCADLHNHIKEINYMKSEMNL